MPKFIRKLVTDLFSGHVYKKFFLVTLVSDMGTEKGLKDHCREKGGHFCKQGNEVSAVGEADESDTINLYDRKEFKSNLFI